MDSEAAAKASSSEHSSGKEAAGTKVACKAAVMIRPLLSGDKTTTVLEPSPEGRGRHHVALAEGSTTKREYGPFDAIPKNAQDLYDEHVDHMLKDLIGKGFNVTLLAYGQTGSGKTYTMGSGEPVASPGLIQLTVASLFKRLPPDTKVRATFVQIWCEEVHDLLADVGHDRSADGRSMGLKKLKVGLNEQWMNEQKPGHCAKGATAVRCDGSPDKVLATLKSGVRNRTTGATKMNEYSSRSHALFTLQLEIPSTDGSCLCPRLHFVDLAGSERSERAETTGQRLKEGNQINKSLLELGKVINALSKGEQAFVRNSMLTMLLQDSLGGNAQTLFVACVSPAADSREESRSTLDYASRVRQITNSVSRVKVAPAASARSQRDAPDKAAESAKAVEAAERAEAQLAAEREEHANQRDVLQQTIDELRARNAELEGRLQRSAQSEVRIRETVIATEQRLEAREKALGEAEEQLREAEQARTSAVKGEADMAAELASVRDELRRAQGEQAKEGCAQCRMRIEQPQAGVPVPAKILVETKEMAQPVDDAAESVDSEPAGAESADAESADAEPAEAEPVEAVDVSDESVAPLQTARQPNTRGVTERRATTKRPSSAMTEAELTSTIGGGPKADFAKGSGRGKYGDWQQQNEVSKDLNGQGQRWPYNDQGSRAAKVAKK